VKKAGIMHLGDTLRSRHLWRIAAPVLMLPLWYFLYNSLHSIANWVVDDVLNMLPGERTTESLRFFIYEVPKVLLLLIIVIFFVGIIRTYFSPEKTRRFLAGRSQFTGNVLASLLGIVTPFCSCSAIPLFIGFVESGVPLGVTFSFLIAAPMINEVAVILLFGLFGWETALIYVVAGLTVAMIAGYIIMKFNLEHWVQDWVYKARFGNDTGVEEKFTLSDRVTYGFAAVKEIITKVWIFIIIGIAVGAAAHGFVPENFMASLMGKSVWYSVPLSVLIGVPLYSNAAGVIPIVSVLLEKGASFGTTLAFMMSVIALSLPEIIILKKVLKLPLIFTFIGIVAAGIIMVGYLFNAIM